jgi:hypothetical protein
VQNIFTVAKLTAIAIVIGGGLYYLGLGTQIAWSKRIIRLILTKIKSKQTCNRIHWEPWNRIRRVSLVFWTNSDGLLRRPLGLRWMVLETWIYCVCWNWINLFDFFGRNNLNFITEELQNPYRYVPTHIATLCTIWNNLKCCVILKESAAGHYYCSSLDHRLLCAHQCVILDRFDTTRNNFF